MLFYKVTSKRVLEVEIDNIIYFYSWTFFRNRVLVVGQI